MTAAALFSHALLSVAAVLLGRAKEADDRAVVRVAVMGVLVGIGTVVFRPDLGGWRGVVLEPGPTALIATAIACGWALVGALDLGSDRWWVGGLVGITGTSLFLFAGSGWSSPGLIFWLVASGACAVALARIDHLSWALLGCADVALVAAVWIEHLGSGTWDLPSGLSGSAAALLGGVVLVRCGVVPAVGINALLATPAAVFAPLLAAGGSLVALRLIERPVPLAGALSLALAVAVGVVALVRRDLNPRIVGAWPPLVGVGLMFSSTAAGTIASIGAVLGITAVMLWPAARERGRLSRGFLLTAGVPNLTFAAIAVTAVGAFEQATGRGSAIEVAGWVGVASLLPLVLGTGIALGAGIARAEASGGYHPEAVFATWLLLAASVTAGLLLGPGEVYAVLGGIPAVVLLGVALVAGILAARSSPASSPLPDDPPAVDITIPLRLPRWGAALGAGLQLVALAAVLWFTFRGLKVGFL